MYSDIFHVGRMYIWTDYIYESDYVANLAKTDVGLARKFNLCKRYIDDEFVGNFPEFKEHIYQIYPRELEIKLESNNNKEVAYLDLLLKSENDCLISSVYFRPKDSQNRFVSIQSYESQIKYFTK